MRLTYAAQWSQGNVIFSISLSARPPEGIRGSLPAETRQIYPCGTRTGGLRRSFLALRA
jgi:hypothetical protein